MGRWLSDRVKDLRSRHVDTCRSRTVGHIDVGGRMWTRCSPRVHSGLTCEAQRLCSCASQYIDFVLIILTIHIEDCICLTPRYSSLCSTTFIIGIFIPTFMQTFVSSKGNDPIYSKVLDDILCMEIYFLSLFLHEAILEKGWRSIFRFYWNRLLILDSFVLHAMEAIITRSGQITERKSQNSVFKRKSTLKDDDFYILKLYDVVLKIFFFFGKLDPYLVEILDEKGRERIFWIKARQHRHDDMAYMHRRRRRSRRWALTVIWHQRQWSPVIPL